MLPRTDDPIAAVATAAGRGAVGIVRVSGRALGPLAEALCGRLLAPRHAHYGPFLDARGESIDRGLALFFPSPHSSTGEDVLELQAHGGPVVLRLLLARCLEAAAETDPRLGSARLPGLRLANPGEFTQRAFLNDKLDLAQAEAVADLIDASTEAAARSAGRSLEGAFSREVHALREQLLSLRVQIEATLDFPEEEIDFLQQVDARGRLDRCAVALDTLLGRARQGALLREGLRIVLAGQPNVGKSSLLNALAGAEVAIVTPIAGTTRDKVSETLQIEGVPLHLTDTAGLRAEHEASDDVERQGMERSWGAIGTADAVIFLHDLARVGEPAYAEAEEAIAARLPAGVPRLDVYNKLDLFVPGASDGRPASTADSLASPPVDKDAIRISALTGEGINALRQRLLALAGWQSGGEGVFAARERHLEALRATREHLSQAQGLGQRADAPLELLAEELRRAHDALGAITGAYSADDLLGDIFGRFCIGK